MFLWHLIWQRYESERGFKDVSTASSCGSWCAETWRKKTLFVDTAWPHSLILEWGCIFLLPYPVDDNVASPKVANTNFSWFPVFQNSFRSGLVLWSTLRTILGDCGEYLHVLLKSNGLLHRGMHRSSVWRLMIRDNSPQVGFLVLHCLPCSNWILPIAFTVILLNLRWFTPFTMITDGDTDYWYKIGGQTKLTTICSDPTIQSKKVWMWNTTQIYYDTLFDNIALNFIAMLCVLDHSIAERYIALFWSQPCRWQHGKYQIDLSCCGTVS